MMTSRFAKKDWENLFFYLDILFVGIFVVAVTLLIMDSYRAGFWDARQDSYNQGVNSWRMMRDAVLAVVSFLWIVVRHFKDKVQHFINPWA